MKRSVWKWILAISIVLLILLIVFFVGVSALANLAGAASGSAMDTNGLSEYTSLKDNLYNAVGSPWFYVCVADIILLTVSVVALIITRNKNEN